MTWRRRGQVWAVVLVAVASLAAGCYRDYSAPDTNVPLSVEEACTWLDPPAQPPSRADVEAVREMATDRVADKYEVVVTSVKRCQGQPVLSIGISSGDVSDADRAFTVDGVGVILYAQRDVKLS